MMISFSFQLTIVYRSTNNRWWDDIRTSQFQRTVCRVGWRDEAGFDRLSMRHHHVEWRRRRKDWSLRWRWRFTDRPAKLRRVGVDKHLVLVPTIRFDSGHKHGPTGIEVTVDTSYQRFERLRSRIHTSSSRLRDGRCVASCSIHLVDRRVGADQTDSIGTVSVGSRLGFATALTS